MKYDIIVIGMGIVGLSTVKKLLDKKPQLNILIIDKEKEVASHQTGNNSGVIHSGLYYKPNSLKAKNCINGYHMLLEFCKQHDIKHEICGKLVVATDKNQLQELDKLYHRGVANGLKGISTLNKDQINDYEPYVNAIAGLHVPQTGIVDYVEVAKKIRQIIQHNGCQLQFNEKVEKIIENKNEVLVQTSLACYSSRLVVNCAGLYSDKISQSVIKELRLQIIPFRGEYYDLVPSKHYLVKNLVYPVPNPDFPFLGVHFTRMIHGGIEAGPNAVLAFCREGYKKRDFKLDEFWETLIFKGFQKIALKYYKNGAEEMYRSIFKFAFVKALQKLIPTVKAEDLIKSNAGVRAQACDVNGNLLDDFAIKETERTINVLNAPSPAATSSFSIGDSISNLAIKRLN